MSSSGTEQQGDHLIHAQIDRPDLDRERSDGEGNEGWFRRLVTYSLLSALAAAIPIPFVDDHLLRRTRRRLAREMSDQASVDLREIEINHLSGTDPGSLSSCLLGCVVGQTLKVVVKLVRRVFRSVLFFLTIKDAVDAFSKTFHEGFLLHLALPGLGQQLDARQDFLTRSTDDSLPRDRELVPEILTLRNAVEATCEEIDPRPLESTIKTIFRRSGKVLRRAARVFARDARRAEKIDPSAEPDAEEGRKLAPELIDLLTSSLQNKQGYLRELETHFRKRWSPRSTPGPSER